MLGPRKEPISRQPGEISIPAVGRPIRTQSSHAARATPRGRPNSSIAIVLPAGRPVPAPAGSPADRHVAEEVREREPVERRVVERQPLGLALDELDSVAQAGGVDALPSLGEHLAALVEADDAAPRAAHELDRDRGGPGGHVQHPVVRPDVHPGDEEAAPARILSEGEETRVPVACGPQRGEEVESLILHGSIFPA